MEQVVEPVHTEKEVKNGRAIVVTSGKGGVGKTTTTANIGTGLALSGHSVCLVDTDIGLRNLDIILGLDNRSIYNLVDVITGQCKLNQALVRDKRFEEMYLLPAAQSKDKTSVNPEQVKEIVDQLKTEFDFVLIDCPAGIEQGFMNAIAGADEAIVVTTPEKAAVQDADRIIGMLEQADHIDAPKLIVNRVKNHLVESGDMLDIDDIMRILSIDLLGVVIDDEEVIAAANRGVPVTMNPDNYAGQAYRNITRRILGESVPLMSIQTETAPVGFWARLMMKFRMKKA